MSGRLQVSGSIRRVWLCLCASALIAAGPMLAQTATIQLTGTNNGFSQAGVYTSPYTGTITPTGGTPVQSWIICGDYYDETYLGETWTASVTSVADLPQNSPTPVLYNGTSWAGNAVDQTLEYKAIALLAEQMLGIVQHESTDSGVTLTHDEENAAAYGFAIWNLTNVFNYAGQGGSVNPYHTCTQNQDWQTCSNDSTNVLHGLSQDEIVSIVGNGTTVSGYITDALTAAAGYQLSQFSNVKIYNWDPTTTPSGCGGSCPPPPQEFIAVSPVAMPEPGTPVQFAFFCSCAAVLVYLSRRQISTGFRAK